MEAFTRNHTDDSTDAGFEFTFYCDICEDGFKSDFIESTTYKKKSNLDNLSQGISAISNLFGGIAGNIGSTLEQGGSLLSERFESMGPEWQKEHEAAFRRAQDQVKPHFHKCHSCHAWVCNNDYNEDEGLCVECAPRTEIYVAKAKADAMRRNIDETAAEATVWSGTLESTTSVCPSCGKPAGAGNFCNNCGASLALNVCPSCGKENAQGVKFCNHCGSAMSAAKQSPFCVSCGAKLTPGVSFCGECGTKVG